MTDIQTIIALLIAALTGLGLGALLRRPRTEGRTPTQQRPAPDTTAERADDAIAADVAEATPPRPDPADYPADEPDAVAEFSKWVDEL